MKVLVACEESQAVCKAFRARGHEAYSCDILPCSGGHPEWHIQDDVLNHLGEGWDLIIAHPPCTYLSVAGNRWFNEERYGELARERKRLRAEAADFFMAMIEAPCDKICVENPVGWMNSHFRKPDQIIQPFEYGHPYTKQTCLWLKGLDKLKPTKVLTRPASGWLNESIDKNGRYSGVVIPKGLRWCDAEVKRLRSQTYTGIAEAMAEQWG